MSGRNYYQTPEFLAALDLTTAQSAPEAAARWWGSMLLSPSRNNSETGPTPTNLYVRYAAWLAADDRRQDVAAKVIPFVQHLRASIETALEARPEGIAVGTDYDPDETLSSAAQKAGIDVLDAMTFPRKSETLINADSVFTVTPRGGLQQVWPPDRPASPKK